MNIVVDTSVLVAVIANEASKAALIALTEGAVLFAPASAHWEVGNALSAMLKRKRATLEQTQQMVAAYRQIPLRLIDVDLDQALALAAQLDIYAYDAYLLTCSAEQKWPLLTLDGGLRQAAQRVGGTILEVKL